MVDCAKIKTCIQEQGVIVRPNASPGLWSMFLIPISLIVSCIEFQAESTPLYKASALFSAGMAFTSLVFVYNIFHGRFLKLTNVWVVVAYLVTQFLFLIILKTDMYMSLLSGVLSTFCYHKLYHSILRNFPNSFTLGEAAICCQSVMLVFYSLIRNIFDNAHRIPSSVMQMSTFTIQIGLFGICVPVLLIWKWGIRNPKPFYSVYGASVLFLILLPLQAGLRRNPLLWIVELLFADQLGIKIVLLWSASVALTVLAVNLQIRRGKRASSRTRKIFHGLAVGIFVPGLLYNCSLLYLASGVLLGIFIALETMRILHMPPIGQYLQDGYVVFVDEKDLGIVALTPIYLLVGCSIPLWIHPAPCDVTNSAVFNLLPLLGGVLAVGVGDAAASIVGSRFGKRSWNGSKKSMEGTFACIVSQLLAVYALHYLEFLVLPSAAQIVKVVAAVTITSLIEAKTDQVDNLVMPLIMYIILIV